MFALKKLGVFLIAMVVSGLCFAAAADFAMVRAESSIAKPSVPEFTLQIVNDSYITVTIKNQLFNASNDILCYNIRIRQHNSDNWTELYQPYGETDLYPGYPIQSTSNYTQLSIAINNELLNLEKTIPAGTQTDIQVQAIAGHMSRIYNPNATSPVTMWPWEFVGESSGWSNTQTIMTPKITPTQPSTATRSDWIELTLFATLTIIIVLVIAIAFRHKKSKKSNP